MSYHLPTLHFQPFFGIVVITGIRQKVWYPLSHVSQTSILLSSPGCLQVSSTQQSPLLICSHELFVHGIKIPVKTRPRPKCHQKNWRKLKLMFTCTGVIHVLTLNQHCQCTEENIAVKIQKHVYLSKDNKMHLLTEWDSRLAHYFALFGGLGLLLGYLAKSDIIFLLDPDFL